MKKHEIIEHILVKLGGPGSGHHGHAGVPGKRGGSMPGGSLISTPAVERFKRSYPNIRPVEVQISGDMKSHAQQLYRYWQRLDGKDWETVQKYMSGGSLAPIILGKSGVIVDGWHRVVALVIAGKDRVQAYEEP